MRRSRVNPRLIGFLLGLLLFVLFMSLTPFEVFQNLARDNLRTDGAALDPEVLASSLQTVTALLLLRVVWWITEAIPLPATALLPALALPFSHVVGLSGGEAYHFTFKNTVANYAHPVIYLFLGGLLLAAAMQKWGADRRSDPTESRGSRTFRVPSRFDPERSRRVERPCSGHEEIVNCQVGWALKSARAARRARRARNDCR